MPPGSTTSNIVGIVQEVEQQQPAEGALVVLECDCLPETRETTTNEQGAYSFKELPEGKYVVRVLYGTADVQRHVQISSTVRARVDVRVSDIPVVVT